MVIRQPQPELPVDLGLVSGFSLVQHGQQPAESVDQAADLLAAHPPVSSPPVLGLRQFGGARGPLGLDLPAPCGHERGVGSGFEEGAMPGELAVALGQSAPQGLGLGVRGRLGLLQRGERVLDARRSERLREPGIQGIAQVGLAQVGVEGVVDLVGHGVLAREPAPVVRLVVSPVALHAASAGAVDQQALERVPVTGAHHVPRGGRGRAGGGRRACGEGPRPLRLAEAGATPDGPHGFRHRAVMGMMQTSTGRSDGGQTLEFLPQ
ncbi:hypothetical protein [Streptomyces sp. OE57]|uniref:hypothetical protein n=1 Tax=Streptomyces lacaronensis TaxID=3379885 RepID=UPI0039B78F6C